MKGNHDAVLTESCLLAVRHLHGQPQGPGKSGQVITSCRGWGAGGGGTFSLLLVLHVLLLLLHMQYIPLSDSLPPLFFFFFFLIPSLRGSVCIRSSFSEQASHMRPVARCDFLDPVAYIHHGISYNAHSGFFFFFSLI